VRTGERKLTGEEKWKVPPGDLSSAVFLSPRLEFSGIPVLHIQAVGLNPTRTADIGCFCALWALPSSMLSCAARKGEIIGDIAVKGAELKGGVIAGAGEFRCNR